MFHVFRVKSNGIGLTSILLFSVPVTGVKYRKKITISTEITQSANA